MKNERIVSFTAEELKALQAKAGPRDWTRFDSVSDSELARLIAEDPEDDGEVSEPWALGLPQIDALSNVEPDLLNLLPPPGPARNAEVTRIIREYLKRKAARLKRAG
jgi:hypothetical protein